MKTRFNFNLSQIRVLLWPLSLVVVLFASGCLNDDNPEPVEVAYVGIYHASPDAGDLDIHVGGNLLNQTPFGYSEYTGYHPFYTGDRVLRFSKANNGSTVILDTTFTFLNNKYYTVFISDTLSSMEALVLGDSADTPGSGKAMVRLAHLSPDAPTVEMLAEGETLFTATSFQEGTSFVETDGGTTTLEFRTDDEENAVVLTVPQVQFTSGEFYTIVLKGYSSPPEGNSNEISVDFIRH